MLDVIVSSLEVGCCEKKLLALWCSRLSCPLGCVHSVMELLGWVLAPSHLSQLATHAPGWQASTWVPATHMGDPDGFLGSHT